MTEMLRRAIEMVSRLPVGEQDAIAAQLLEEVDSAPPAHSEETLQTLLGDAFHRPAAGDEEMAELRRLAETEPGIAAALRLSEQGGLDVDTILAIRNA